MLRATFSSSEASKRRWSNTCGLMGRTELAQSAYRLDARSPRRITQRDTPGTTPNEQLFRTVKNGAASMMPGDETDMPAYKEILSDADIWTVLSFIESTWSADIRERQETGKLRLRIHFGVEERRSHLPRPPADAIGGPEVRIPLVRRRVCSRRRAQSGGDFTFRDFGEPERHQGAPTFPTGVVKSISAISCHRRSDEVRPPPGRCRPG